MAVKTFPVSKNLEMISGAAFPKTVTPFVFV